VDAQNLGDLVANFDNRVEGRLRLLEDHRDAIAAHMSHFGLGQFEQVLVIEDDFALGNFTGLADEPHDREQADAFSTTRLANQTKDFARVHNKIHPIHSLYDPIFCEKICLEILNFQKRFLHGLWLHGTAPQNELHLL
jgi:hypothetical protein